MSGIYAENTECEDKMKQTTDYMVGNTAFQIVNKGKKIIVVDVEKEKARKKFWRKCLFTLAAGVVIFLLCLNFVRLENNKVMLNSQVYAMQGEITEIEGELRTLEKMGEQKAVDFTDILKQAKAMGMKFPKENQICYYKADKSTAVRVKYQKIAMEN